MYFMVCVCGRSPLICEIPSATEDYDKVTLLLSVTLNFLPLGDQSSSLPPGLAQDRWGSNGCYKKQSPSNEKKVVRAKSRYRLYLLYCLQ
jgi:hypothetical protein